MPETLITRPYVAPEDLDKIIALVETRPAERLANYPSPTDLREMLSRPKFQRLTRVWETPGGQMAGYALLSFGQNYASLAFECAPAFSLSETGPAMLDWCEQVFCQEYHGEAEALSSSTRADQLERIHLLEQHGYQRASERVIFFERSLRESVPAPQLPDGFTLRPLAGEQETAAWVALHRAGFGTENMTIEARLSWSALPDYDPNLDLVAVAPDGTLAAYVYGAIHPDENALTGRKVGYTDPVATHPDFQRLGLARALLFESLRRLKARGMELAHLGTSSDNLAMQRAAQSAGFCAVSEAWHFSKIF